MYCKPSGCPHTVQHWVRKICSGRVLKLYRIHKNDGLTCKLVKLMMYWLSYSDTMVTLPICYNAEKFLNIQHYGSNNRLLIWRETTKQFTWRRKGSGESIITMKSWIFYVDVDEQIIYGNKLSLCHIKKQLKRTWIYCTVTWTVVPNIPDSR